MAGTCSAGAGEWIEKSHPLIGGKDEVLRGVKALTGQDVWAAGYVWGTVGGALEFRTHVLHWNGASWTISNSIDVESAPALNLLFGIDGSGPADMWTVGYYRDQHFLNRSLIEHWNGTNWTIVPAPAVGTGHNELEAISAPRPGDAWAVGTATMPSIDYGPIALHWDGLQWQSVPVPIPDFCKSQIDLTSIVVGAPRNVLAAGHCLTASGRQGFVLRYNGIRWKVSAGPDSVPQNSQLFAVTFVSGTEAWAVGMANNAALTMHLVDGIWSAVAADAAGPNSSLASISVRAPTDIWAVGAGSSTQPPFAGRLALHWNGTAWSIAPAGNFGSFNGVDMIGRQTWAVGQNISDSLIMWRRD